MSRLLKSATLYLLMLATPVQGFAATAMLHCGLADQPTTTAPEPAHHAAQGHSDRLTTNHQKQLPAALSSDAGSYASIDASVVFVAADNSAATGGDKGMQGGSGHAACYAGAIAPGPGMKFQPADPTIERLASKQLPNIAFVTDAPARPPRSCA